MAAPTPTADPSPTVVAPPTALRWEQWGEIEPPADEHDMAVGFAAGYLASSHSGRAAWFSVDGRSWEAMTFGEEVPFCPGAGLGTVPETQVWGMATNGEAVMLTLRHLEADCYEGSGDDPFVHRLWLSTDGQTWQMSDARDLFTPIAVPGGWEAFALDGGRVSRWTSADGLAWEEVGPIGRADGWTAVSGPDGARVLRTFDALSGRSTLLHSADGEAWQEIRLPDEDAHVDRVAVALLGDEAVWLTVLIGSTWAATDVLLWSRDLETWQQADLPALVIRALGATSGGFVLSAEPPCEEDNDFGCDPQPQRQFISRDGHTWTETSPALYSVSALAEGPAGIIAIGADDPDWWFEDPQEVWRLVP